jgi:hypothetical protein
MMKLFTTLYGSKLYGTSTPTSDRDIKHIVLPSLDDLLLGKKLEAKVKKTNKVEHTRNSADDIDEEFIPLQIFARHFVEGQTYAIELAFAVEGTHAEQEIFDSRGRVTRSIPFRGEGSPMVAIRDVQFDCTAYEDPMFLVFVRELREKFLTSNIKAMMGYVVNQASLYSFKGERLNATRELLAIFNNIDECFDDESMTLDFVDDESAVNFKPFADKFTELAAKYPKYFRRDVYDIGGGRMKPCMVILEKVLPYTNSYQQCIKVVHALEKKYGSRADAATANNVDWKATMHALRIVDEGLQILSTRKLSFPFDENYVNHLLSIKRGELPLDPIKEELATKLDKLKDLEKTTDLPTCNAEFMEEFNEWMVNWLYRFYKL